MIPRTRPRIEAPSSTSWRRQLAESVRDVGELLELLRLSSRISPQARQAARGFPLRVPRGFVARMVPGDPDDPLLRQVLPLDEEMRPALGFGTDPLGESRVSPAPGLLHKYRGRALLVVTGACAIHCRYCFRRHFPYAEHARGEEGWDEALAYLRADSSIREVILSGGDPLSVGDARLGALAQKLAGVPHLERLRIHSRLPVVLPQRVDDELLAWFAGTRLQPVMVIHANHPREIDAEVEAALERLRRAGVVLLNQAVLLRGVNDSFEALRGLSERLLAAGTLPYYLHLLDRVEGAAHFEVPEARARGILSRLREGLPGYLVPRLVREVEGAPGKVPLELLAP